MTVRKPPATPRQAASAAAAPVSTAGHDATTIYRLVGERVRARRTSLGMTQEALARAVGAARTSITNLEKGTQHVPLHVLLAVADELGADVAELLPTRTELGVMRDPHVALDVGDGEARMVPAKTASAIARLMQRLPPRAG